MQSVGLSPRLMLDMLLVFTVFILFSVAQIKGLSLPSYIKPCPFIEADFDTCALKHGQEAVPYILKGDPEYGIPDLDPWEIPTVHVGEFGLTIEASNITIMGFDAGVLQSIKTDFTNRKVMLRYKIPNVHFVGNYNMSGKLVSIPVRGYGDFDNNMYNTTLEYITEFDVIKKNDGQEYAVPKGYDMMFYPENMKLYFKNLFGGNKLVDRAINTLLNDNWKIVMEEAGRPATRYVGKQLHEVITELCGKIPIKEIFT